MVIQGRVLVSSAVHGSCDNFYIVVCARVDTDSVTHIHMHCIEINEEGHYHR